MIAFQKLTNDNRCTLRGKLNHLCIISVQFPLTLQASPSTSSPAAPKIPPDVDDARNNSSSSSGPKTGAMPVDNLDCKISSQRATSLQSFAESTPCPSGKRDLLNKLRSLKVGSLINPAAVGPACLVHSGRSL